jgi:hypothetical protein
MITTSKILRGLGLFSLHFCNNWRRWKRSTHIHHRLSLNIRLHGNVSCCLCECVRHLWHFRHGYGGSVTRMAILTSLNFFFVEFYATRLSSNKMTEFLIFSKNMIYFLDLSIVCAEGLSFLAAFRGFLWTFVLSIFNTLWLNEFL